MDTTKTRTSTPAIGLSRYVATAHSAFTAPNALEQGTAVPFAGMSAAAADVQVAFGARVAALSGLPPRGAPV